MLRTRFTNQSNLYRRPIIALLAVTLCSGLAGWRDAAAEDAAGPAVVRVEEDWELVLNEPANEKACPQFETVMSLGGDLTKSYARVTWNYRELPEFYGAGLQLQSWYGAAEVSQSSVSEEKLSAVAETIRWTQVIKVDGEYGEFRIVDGQSTTWGDFGCHQTRIYLFADDPHLNHYSSDVSMANCRISYGLNRVVSLRIKEVRRYDASGQLLSRDESDRVLYGSDADAEQ